MFGGLAAKQPGGRAWPGPGWGVRLERARRSQNRIWCRRSVSRLVGRSVGGGTEQDQARSKEQATRECCSSETSSVAQGLLLVCASLEVGFVGRVSTLMLAWISLSVQAVSERAARGGQLIVWCLVVVVFGVEWLQLVGVGLGQPPKQEAEWKLPTPRFGEPGSPTHQQQHPTRLSQAGRRPTRKLTTPVGLLTFNTAIPRSKRQSHRSWGMRTGKQDTSESYVSHLPYLRRIGNLNTPGSNSKQYNGKDLHLTDTSISSTPSQPSMPSSLIISASLLPSDW
jgi:hypothetical protein